MDLANNHNNCKTIIRDSIPFFETGSQSKTSAESNTVRENNFVGVYLFSKYEGCPFWFKKNTFFSCND